MVLKENQVIENREVVKQVNRLHQGEGKGAKMKVLP
jgi:hypothetical protein